MSYLKFIPQADKRRASSSTVPIDFVNVHLEPTPVGAAKRSEFFVTSRPGMVAVATLPANVRGLFAAPGCRNGNLFAPAGDALFEVFSSYSFSNVGMLSGGDVVTMVAYRDDLALEAFGQLKFYDGALLDSVVDVDAPADAGGLAAVALRLVSFEDGAVAFGWSEAGAPLTWPSDGEAATPDLSDPIVTVAEINERLWVFGARKIRPWQATGAPAEADAFTKATDQAIARGIAGPHAKAPVSDGELGFLGENRVAHKTQGLSVVPLPYPSMEAALKALTPAQLADVVCWGYEDASRRFWGVSAGLEQAFVRDETSGLWAEWKSYGKAVFDIDFAANAFGETIVGSRSSAVLSALRTGVYTDNDEPIVREFTIHISSAGDVPVDRLVFDIDTVDVPLSGEGSEPKMQVATSVDNGRSWVQHEDVDLPHVNNRFRAMMWALGLANAVDGMLVRCSISGPFGFAAYGIWVNPDDTEITMA